jgi:two-component system response regulator NreC
MEEDPAHARAAIAAGASRYVLKEAADDGLVDAVRAAAGGDTYLNPRLGARVSRALAKDPEGRQPSAGVFAREATAALASPER